ncbi:MAG: AraC family transcriptional regulator, partial [Thermoflexibacteraceae bacterium]
MKNRVKPTIINSVSELHRLIGLPKPHHPLVSLINLDTVPNTDSSTTHHLILNFYSVSLKKNVKGKLKYGQHYYDFDEGVLATMSPGQLLSTRGQDNYEASGW